jgi:hypothetical protein
MNDNGELVKTYLTIRNERDRIAAEWKAKDRELENDLNVLGQQLLSICNDTNSTGFNTGMGRVTKKLYERYTVSDGDSFRSFVMEHQMPELFEARINQGNFKEFLKEHEADGLPPGVNVMREFKVVVTKPSNS